MTGRRDQGPIKFSPGRVEPCTDETRKWPACFGVHKEEKQNEGHTVKDGKYTANRAGAMLCPGFQTGVGNTKGFGTRREVDDSLAHQFAL